MVALAKTRDEGREQVEDMEPVTMAGIAASAHVAWATDAMPHAEGSARMTPEVSCRSGKMLVGIWRCASGETGLPPADGFHHTGVVLNGLLRLVDISAAGPADDRKSRK